MGKMNDERIREHNKLVPPGIELHDVGHLVPSETYKSLVVSLSITLDDDIRLVVR